MNKAATKTSNDPISLDTKKVSSNKRKTQKEKALEAFIQVGESGFYQIPAYKTFSTTCLHTVVSNFQKEGIMFARKTIMHRNSDGGETPFTLYWLKDEEAISKALDRINILRIQRSQPPYLGRHPFLINSLTA
tara:strand:- start:4725 stop:5123 length:399 start_codon:yes stop_codon:yes gene_type:complete